MSGTATTWLAFYPGDYLKDCFRFTTEQHGAYFLLLMEEWTQGRPLPAADERLAEIAGLSVGRFLKAVKTRVMAKFTLTDEGYVQKRLEAEREKAVQRAQISQINGKRGGRPKSLKSKGAKNPRVSSGLVLGSVQVTPSPSPSPSQEPNKTEKEGSKCSEPLAGAQTKPDEPVQLRRAHVETKRKSRLDPGWQPTPKGFDVAREVGMRDVDEQVLQFRDYHAAKGNVMVDWDAAWRTWCRNSVQFSRRSVVPLARKSKLSWMTEDREALNVVPANMFGD